jgi:outer membrane protein OmpA-like peptidoglycan-associated protein
MNPGPKLPPVVLWLVSVAVPALLVILWLRAAQGELTAAPESAEGVAVASMTDDTYCTADLKRVLRRVAGACGLLAGAGRGCQPSDAKTVAQMNDADFNALFGPMRDRTQIIQFDADDTSLDEAGRKAVERAWATQGGASFFFVVSRASPDGNKTHNLELSKARAETVMKYITAQDAELEKQIGLLYLGEEYAQLGEEFCTWQRSRKDSECTSKEINRSAFVAWIDCAI